MNEKEENLKQLLQSYKTLAVAFSGGVDSTYLLKTAKEVLGNKVLAVTVTSCLFPKGELAEAKEFCKENHIAHVLVDFDPFLVKGFQQNPKNRCYLCKRALFEGIRSVAKDHGIENIAEASNMDDLSDYRPGLLAIEELAIISPLREALLYKSEIRQLSQTCALKTAKKPSFACLASRFPYGDIITKEKLAMVEAAEHLLAQLGFVQYRVRLHQDVARIEVDSRDFSKIVKEEVRNKITAALREFGFSYVTLDLEGYRIGSMNEILSKEELKNYATQSKSTN